MRKYVRELYIILLLIKCQLDTGSLISQLIAHPANRREGFLENSREFEEIYGIAARGGATSPPAVEEEVDLHYITLVKLPDGFVYELDGDAHAPTKTSIKLGDDADLLSEPVLEHIRSWMAREQDLHFSLLALVEKPIFLIVTNVEDIFSGCGAFVPIKRCPPPNRSIYL